MNHAHFQFSLTRYRTPRPSRSRHALNKTTMRRSAALLRNLAVATAIWGTAAVPSVSAEESIVRSMAEIESGTLLFAVDSRSHYLRAPLLDTSVTIGVQGLLARTIVEQTFTNQSSEWVEGVYAFPLPDDATVDELAMIIGEKRIDGVVQTRQQAQNTYDSAKRSGKKASLLEQQRPNLFTTRIANIPPGDSITVRIAYQSSVRYTDGNFKLNFPLTITPRYIPGNALRYRTDDIVTASGWATEVNRVPDARQISPPFTDQPSRVSIAVTLDTGLDGLTIASSTHDIISTPNDNATRPVWNISLANNEVPADRDFKLNWTPALTTAPVAAVFRQDNQLPGDGETFASLMLMPPQQIFAGALPEREVIFVIDTSQSMSGSSIVQARKTLALGIERLDTRDSFNVIEFDNNSSRLFPNAVAANDKNKTRAIAWVNRLAADGGTEILGAMQAALHDGSDDTQTSDERLRQIVFVTDGSVGNEDEIFRYLKQHIGSARLFTIGIGSAPNTWFMRKSAELGRGTFTSIANTSELVDKTLLLLAKLEQPALTNIQLQFNTESMPEVYPTVIPDLYMGEPLLADARWTSKLDGGDIQMSGTFAGQHWTQQIKLNSLASETDERDPLVKDKGSNNQGLDKLWASRKIQSLEDNLLLDQNYAEVESKVTDIALNYGLVTKYTSLVAVENTVSRDVTNTGLQTASLPQAIPAGSTMHYPQGSLGTTLRFLTAFILVLLAGSIALPYRRQADTSDVCIPLRSIPQRSHDRVTLNKVKTRSELQK